MATESVREQATAWAVRTGDPAFDDWDGFTLWLEQDPAHAQAYDAAVLAVAEAAESLPPAPAADNDDEQPAVSVTRRRWVRGALAASVALAVALGTWQLRGTDYTVETAPGEMRVIALDDGGEIVLAGDSSIVLDRRDERLASLTRGQALFTIRHDETAPYRLMVGEDRIVDVGTVFDVKRTPDGTTVSVSEGAVVFNPDGENVHLAPGQILSREGASYRVETIPLSQVGEWREGRITFQNATLAEVAGDLTRATGTRFSAGSSTQRVSGSVLAEPVKRDPRTIGPLLGVTVRYSGEAWEIGAR
jgi:transmembrane sensor